MPCISAHSSLSGSRVVSFGALNDTSYSKNVWMDKYTNLPACNMLIQLLALYTDPERHNAQRYRQTVRQTDGRTTWWCGDAENARHENAKLENAEQTCRGWKMRDWKMWHKNARRENAGLENAAQSCRGWKMQEWKKREKKSMKRRI